MFHKKKTHWFSFSFFLIIYKKNMEQHFQNDNCIKPYLRISLHYTIRFNVFWVRVFSYLPLIVVFAPFVGFGFCAKKHASLAGITCFFIVLYIFGSEVVVFLLCKVRKSSATQTTRVGVQIGRLWFLVCFFWSKKTTKSMLLKRVQSTRWYCLLHFGRD